MGFYILALLGVAVGLFALETWLDHKKGGHNQDFFESITNFNVGLGFVAGDILMKAGAIVAYVFLYENYAFFELEVNVWSVLFSLILFDLLYWLFHYLSHKVNVMWASHLVHHEPEYYNFSVAFRTPWLNKIAMLPFFFPLPFLGISPEIFVIATIISTVWQFMQHTTLFSSYGWLDYVLVSPRFHLVHHARNEGLLDKNFGGVLSIWDRLFGTYGESDEEIDCGTTSGVKTFDPIWSNFHYWGNIWRQWNRTSSVREKLGSLFGPPKGEGKERSYPERPHLTRGERVHVILQAGLGLFCLVLTTMAFPVMDPLMVGLTFSLVFLSVSITAAWMEKRTWVVLLELVRLQVCVVLISLSENSMGPLIWFLLAVTVATTATAFARRFA